MLEARRDFRVDGSVGDSWPPLQGHHRLLGEPAAPADRGSVGRRIRFIALEEAQAVAHRSRIQRSELPAEGQLRLSGGVGDFSSLGHAF